MGKKEGEKDQDGGQPKVFQISEKDLEDLLQNKDQIAAGKKAKPGKKRKAKVKEEPPEDKDEKNPAIAGLREKAGERDRFLERLQRVQAEYINYQKRIKRERVEWADLTLREFLEKILPLLDDFDGATRAAGSGDYEVLSKGMEILRDHFWKILSDHGVEEIPMDGGTFDPKLHEAMAQEVSTEAEEGSILEVLQKGYRFKEWVLRPIRVKIARAEPPEAPPAEPAESEAPAPAAREEPSDPPVTGNPLLDEPDEQPHG